MEFNEKMSVNKLEMDELNKVYKAKAEEIFNEFGTEASFAISDLLKDIVLDDVAKALDQSNQEFYGL